MGDERARCVQRLRIGGWEAATAEFAQLAAAIPAPPPEWAAPGLRRLLEAREREDPLEAADLLEVALATLFGDEPVPTAAEAAKVAAQPSHRTGSDGVARRIFSAVDPDRETALQWRALPRGTGPLLLGGCAGTPLLDRILADEGVDSPLLIWEPDVEGYELARAALAVTARPVRLLDPGGPPSPEAVRGVLDSAGGTDEPLRTWIHPWLAGGDREMAWRVSAVARVATAGGPASPSRARLARREGLRVVMLDRGRPFFAEEDLFASLAGAGHEVRAQSVAGNSRDVATADALIGWRPDLVLSVNGAALAQSPLVRETLAVSGIPTVLWFVDDPETSLRPLSAFSGDHVLALAWEREAVGRLRAHGFSGAAYLPHATRLSESKVGASLPGSADLVWAASSYAGPDRERMARAAGGRAETESLVDAFSEKLAADRRIAPAAVRAALLRLPEVRPWLPTLEDALFVQIRAADRVAAERRAGLARTLIPEGLQLYGDVEGWHRLLGPQVPVAADLHPTRELPRLYVRTGRGPRLCLDLAHPQMPTAVTQRAFDVPACGGLLLADDRPDLREHFEVGREVLAFGCAEEAAELVRWFRRHPTEAERVADAGALRVRRQHRWSRRVRRLLDLVASHFGRGSLRS